MANIINDSVQETLKIREYSITNADVKNAVAKAKNESSHEICQSMDNYIEGTTSKGVWKIVKNLRIKRKETSGIQLINAKEWLIHYEDLLEEKRPQIFNDEPATNIDISFSSMQEDERNHR